MTYACDLHTHTTRSDGADTPSELIEPAAKMGVRLVAITDHDALAPEGLREEAQGAGVALLSGVEFSCETDIEDAHLVGLGFDQTDEGIRALIREARESKKNAYVELIKRMNEAGYDLTLEEALAFPPPVSIDNLQKKRLYDLLAHKGYAQNGNAAKRMVRADERMRVPREKPTMTRAIEALHRAGGIAILAHPYLIAPTVCHEGAEIPRAAFIERMIARGLDGVEARYPYAKATSADPRPDEALWAETRETYGGRLLLSGGSDYHHETVFGVVNARELGECGLTMEEFVKNFPDEIVREASI